jgi:hypothetical protein
MSNTTTMPNMNIASAAEKYGRTRRWYKNLVRFWIGLLVGALMGAGGMFLGLEKPWKSSESAQVAPDAGPAVAAKGKKTKKKGRKGRKGKSKATKKVDLDEAPQLTPADTKLMWKGQAVKLPTKSVDFEGGDDARSLTPAEINSVIQGSSAPVLSCITSSRGNAMLEATIVLKMLVDGGGKVTKVGVKAPAYLFAHGFLACATSAAKKMRFPGVGGHTVVSAPYDLY